MKLMPPKYLPEYRKRQKVDLPKRLGALRKHPATEHTGDFALVESAVSSSQIEGSKVTIGEYTNAMLVSGGEPRQRDVKEVHDLVTAYRFARKRKLTGGNLREAHRLLSHTLLSGTNDQGAYRTKNIRVGNFWETVYLGPDPSLVPDLMVQLMGEVKALLSRRLSSTEAFYYAAMLHLRYVQVHPFADGNGRSGRLLEKWFLAAHLGPKTWEIRSELYYRLHLKDYYATLRMGRTWGEVDLGRSVPFLLLLPKALAMPRKTALVETALS